MSDGEYKFQGASPSDLMDIACQAVALICDKDPELVKPDEDGEVLCTGDSSGVYVYAESDPSALVFRTYVLDGIKESPALYALINEINADIAIGQMYYSEETKQIRYYYKYLAEAPSKELVASILSHMIDVADLYDDRLKTRLGGERFIEQEDDEIEI